MNKFRTCKHLIFIHVSHVVGFKSRVKCGEERLFARIPSNVWVNSSAANRLIGEVVQSRRRPLLGHKGRLVRIVSYSRPSLITPAIRGHRVPGSTKHPQTPSR